MVSCPSTIPTEQLHALLTEDTQSKNQGYYYIYIYIYVQGSNGLWSFPELTIILDGRWPKRAKMDIRA